VQRAPTRLWWVGHWFLLQDLRDTALRSKSIKFDSSTRAAACNRPLGSRRPGHCAELSSRLYLHMQRKPPPEAKWLNPRGKKPDLAAGNSSALKVVRRKRVVARRPAKWANAGAVPRHRYTLKVSLAGGWRREGWEKSRGTFSVSKSPRGVKNVAVGSIAGLHLDANPPSQRGQVGHSSPQLKAPTMRRHLSSEAPGDVTGFLASRLMAPHFLTPK
jgi:hypothetical protein